MVILQESYRNKNVRAITNAQPFIIAGFLVMYLNSCPTDAAVDGIMLRLRCFLPISIKKNSRLSSTHAE